MRAGLLNEITGRPAVQLIAQSNIILKAAIAKIGSPKPACNYLIFIFKIPPFPRLYKL